MITELRDHVTVLGDPESDGVATYTALRVGLRGDEDLPRVLTKTRPFLKWRKGPGRERCAGSCSSPPPPAAPASRSGPGPAVPLLGVQPVPALE